MKKTIFFLLIWLLSLFLSTHSAKAQNIQTYSGDLYLLNGANFNISPGNFFSFESVRGDSGIVYRQSGAVLENYGNGSETNPNWSNIEVNFKNPFPTNGFYDYYLNKPLLRSTFADPNLCTSSLPASSGFYEGILGARNLAVECSVGGLLLVPANKWYVFFINNLRIKSRIQVEKGGFLAFVSETEIDIYNNVHGGSLTNPDISGVYIANTDFKTGNSPNSLYLEGIFMADQFNFERRGALQEVFIYRPEFLLTAPAELLENDGALWQTMNP